MHLEGCSLLWGQLFGFYSLIPCVRVAQRHECRHFLRIRVLLATPKLTPSKIANFVRCPRRLWNYSQPRKSNHTRYSTKTRDTLIQLACQRYTGDKIIDLSPHGSKEAESLTTDYLSTEDSMILIRPCFSTDKIQVRPDIVLLKSGSVASLVMVKASVRLQKNHRLELLASLWILQALGQDDCEYGVLTIDPSYVKTSQEIDPNNLFKYHNQTNNTQDRLPEFPTLLENTLSLINSDEAPPIIVGRRCHKPSKCDFLKDCHQGRSTAVLAAQLPGIDGELKRQWLIEGSGQLEDLPDDADLKPYQIRAIESIQRNEALGSQDLKEQLGNLKFPIHYLDFEAFTTPIPKYMYSRPYESIPFQFSNHIESSSGEITHHEFIYNGNHDPRREFTDYLLQIIDDAGTICIYSNYENDTLEMLRHLFPHHRERIAAAKSKTWDLMKFVKKNFYHPGFYGSYSLKNVLTCLCPELTYESLDIGDGLHAMNAYLGVNDLTEEERSKLFVSLLEYCKMDTLALLKIRQYLQRTNYNIFPL